MGFLYNEHDPRKPLTYGMEINPEMDFYQRRLQFTTTIKGMQDQMMHESICFKDKAVRTALIALGWTPPPGEDVP